jgi:hypothetical protein
MAYTVGQHIVFNNGTYAPTGLEGRRLLAHELAHTVQQSPGTEPTLARQNDKEGETPPTPGMRTTGLTAAETAQLQVERSRFNVPAGKSTLVGILIDEATGKRYPVRSGESGGPYGGTQRGNVPRGPEEKVSAAEHRPRKTSALTSRGTPPRSCYEHKIKRATLLSPEPPCRVLLKSNAYPGRERCAPAR